MRKALPLTQNLAEEWSEVLWLVKATSEGTDEAGFGGPQPHEQSAQAYLQSKLVTLAE